MNPLLRFLTDPSVNPFLMQSDPVHQAQIRLDRDLMDKISPHIPELTQDELGTVMDAFEYMDPTGLNPKPMPGVLREKMAAIVGRFTEQNPKG